MNRNARGHAAVSASLLAAAVTSTGAWAGAAQWSSTNVQYLYGTEYELGDRTRSIITMEHVNGWKYGDNFLFVDITNPDRSGKSTTTEFYGELSPRLSFGKIAGTDLSFGPLRDLLLTTTLEMGQGFHSYLYGLAADFKIPGFAFFQFNWYLRNEITFATDLGQQITLAWGAPFSLGPASLSFEGFFDYAWGNDPSQDNIITAPRLLIDTGKFWGAPGCLQLGVEYQIWRNKFGIDGVDEDVAQAMVKWIF